METTKFILLKSYPFKSFADTTSTTSMFSNLSSIRFFKNSDVPKPLLQTKITLVFILVKFNIDSVYTVRYAISSSFISLDRIFLANT